MTGGTIIQTLEAAQLDRYHLASTPRVRPRMTLHAATSGKL